MKSIEEIKNYVYDTTLLKKEINAFPHTYKTLLGEECYLNGTMQFVIRKKLNTLHKNGDIYKSVIPGTRFGMVLFYGIHKKYNIIIEGNRIGIKVYCFFGYNKLSKFYILPIKEYYILEDFEWKKINGDKTIFLGNILKWI
jgi:hypothetical protein